MEQNAPRLRFPGFSGAWEKKKLGDIIVQIKRKDSESKAPVMMISATEGFIKQSEKYSRDNAGKSLKKYTILHKGELAYNHGASKIRPYGSSFVLKEKEARVPFVYHSFSTKDNPEFLEKTLNGRYTQKQLKRVITSGARMDGLLNITFENFAKIKVSLPSLPEQEKIADFFSALDEKIDLKEKEIEDVKTLKKGFLQKMFPQDGKSVPRLRFPGFSGNWEKKKLSTLFENFDDGDWIESDDQSTSGIRLIQTGNIGITKFIEKSNHQKWISKDTFKRLHCKEVFPGDILISRLPDPAGRACIVPPLNVRMITAVDCTIARVSNEVLANFIVQYLATPLYFKYVNSFLAGGTRQRISKNSLANLYVTIPSLPEQEKIADFFSALDAKIDAMEKQLEDLKEMKKGFLQQMFI